MVVVTTRLRLRENDWDCVYNHYQKRMFLDAVCNGEKNWQKRPRRKLTVTWQ